MNSLFADGGWGRRHPFSIPEKLLITISILHYAG
jgi:hypothetical protein